MGLRVVSAPKVPVDGAMALAYHPLMGRAALIVSLVVTVAVGACGGDEFADTSTTGGTGGTLPSGGGTGGAGGTAALGGTGGGTGGTTGVGATGAVAGAGAMGGGAGVDAGGGSGTGGVTGCAAPKSFTPLLAAVQAPEYPVRDGAHLYFSSPQAVARIPIDADAGAQQEIVYTGTGTSQVEGLAIHQNGLLLADRGLAKLIHVTLTSPFPKADWASISGGQAILTDGAHFYIAAQPGIRRIPVAGGGLETVFDSPGAFALALAGSEVFWVTVGGDVLKGPKDSSTQQQKLASIPNTLPGFTLWKAASIAIDATDVYFTLRNEPSDVPDGGTPPDGVWRVSRTGGTPQVVLPSSAAEGVVLSESCVYWGSRHVNGRIYVKAKSGGAPTSLGGLNFPTGLVLDSGWLYFTDIGAGTVNRSSL